MDIMRRFFDWLFESPEIEVDDVDISDVRGIGNPCDRSLRDRDLLLKHLPHCCCPECGSEDW